MRPALHWNDQRPSAECDEIRSRVGAERLIQATGNDALTGFTSPKLLWVRNHEPDKWDRVSTVLLPKDYVRFRLTGVRAVDVAGGSGTGLFELGARIWSTEVLAALELDPKLFPPVFEGPELTGEVTAEAADVTGLLQGTPVVGGGGDQSANAVGVGAVSAGSWLSHLVHPESCSQQPAARLSKSTGEPMPSVMRCHAVPGRWHMMGVMLSAAGSLRWLRDAVAPEIEFSELVDAATEADPGSDGLLFLPYLTGERTPHPDPKARGAFVGLTVGHDSGTVGTISIRANVDTGKVVERIRIRSNYDSLCRPCRRRYQQVVGPAWPSSARDPREKECMLLGDAQIVRNDGQ